ncbi:FAD-dependent oxidoreductase [Galbitalea soli]|uniref:FAD-dependent oxidoreductase n=1 Tax=Galbitalea soli TaxID=1268042 RepID=A0A7C9TSU0_9MICO|nr:FAD-dependent oxidoreductase [Galbitalea soli]NEM92419.1 FAD-dependent oxidoreductase [Galbitalea soli]NYJ29453.1 NADPH-dependent 2,4-dienoyl-CoA reductase/sulfur reductase-like enzyme/rhodanese-related sulfurtransferase [Galbitalea soli]
MNVPLTVVIVGGVAGGMSAATRLRRLDENAHIIVVERGDYVSYANCGLPYYVGGVIEDRDSLLLQTPEGLAARFRLDVRTGHEVVAIDRDAQTVTIRPTGTSQTAEQHYDRLILAGGATSTEPRTGGIPSFSLRTVDDVDHITRVLGSLPTAPSAVVIGGGFIGVEAVENLVRRGVSVTVVQRGPHILSPLDVELAALVQERVAAAGVEIRTSTTVTGVEDDRLQLSDGTSIRADVVIDATGVHPDTSLARAAGLRIGESGGIWVDAQQRTSDPLIYAVGDGTEKTDAVGGGGSLIAMAGLANRHGRAAADSIAGTATPAAPALGTAIVGLFGQTIASVGWSESRLVAAGRAHRVVHTHPASHATYYPDAETMHMKLLVDPGTDAILGAQIVGGEGVDKRIDVIATAMSAGLTASALSRLELAYAPQYGSAKDAINQLGYVAENVATGVTETVQWHEVDLAQELGELIVDVRREDEYDAGHIPGALNIPLDELRDRLFELPDTPFIVHCQVGQRGHTAARLLTQHGFSVRNLDGGYLTWRAGTSLTHPHPRIQRSTV